jgi:hypothetical protein
MKPENENFVRDNMYEGAKWKIYGRPIFYGLIGLAVAVMGIYSFVDITKQEATGVVVLNGKTDLLYNLGGKWLVLGVMLLAAAIIFYRAFYFYNGIKEGLKK